MCGIMAYFAYMSLRKLAIYTDVSECVFVFVCLCASERYIITIKFKCHPSAQYVYLYAYDLLSIACKLFN